ncbi:MAG: 2-hydroxyacid dehydrogenase [Rhodospirillales bacterium]|nr:2-hydroxyacid dehydrogenase [Rhodospirillales bacterium]MCB9995779.1 2-hydroxyacid dehydrogenase [Rhodospirillales bacterium]
MAKAILALHNMPPLGLEQLEEQFELIRLWQEKDPDQMIKDRANDIVAIVSSYNRGVSAKMIEALPNLEIISTFGVGYDNIDVRAATGRGVVVTNTPDLLTADTADTALALLLAVSRRVVEGDAYVRVGKWLNGPLPLGTSLGGKTAGIVGLGRIGQAIADRVSAFDVSVAYHGRHEKDVPYRFYPQLEEMARDVDYLILSCAGGPETQHIVNENVLRALGPHGFLVNVARGSVVDQDALLVALSNKNIAGAALDVYDNEPHVPEALFSMDNVVLLPHIGSATVETRAKMGQLVIDNILAHFNGEPLKTPVAA